jgi:folylpolyglutamate synthase/dihydropteroate synthase
MLGDKDVAGIWRGLAPIAQRVILPQVRTERALVPEDLLQTISTITPSLPTASPVRTSIAPSLPAALESARTLPERILITGSLHFAGEALATLDGNPDALEDCAQ